MIHNHVTELINLFKSYESAIWSFLKKTPESRTLDNQILYVGDRPTTNFIERLQDYSSGLKAIISVADYGVISYRHAWFGTYDVDASIRVGVELLTADPSLREEIGSCLITFITRNPGLIVGKATPWGMETIQSGGYKAAPAGLFSRIYYLWLREIS